MKVVALAALGWAALTVAGPVQFFAREENCSCEPETVVVTTTVPPETAPPTTTSVPPVITTTTTTMATTTTTAWETTTTTAWETTTTTTTTETETPPPTDTAPVTTTAPPTTTSSTPTPTPGCEEGHCHGTGPILQDEGPQINKALVVVGKDGTNLLVHLSKGVTDLLSGHVSTGQAIGEVLYSVTDVTGLLTHLAPILDCIITILGEDGTILVVKLVPDVAALINGLPIIGGGALGNPAGNVVGTGLLKREVPALGNLGHVAQVLDTNGQTRDVAIPGPVGDALGNGGVVGIVGNVFVALEAVTTGVEDLGPTVGILVVGLGNNLEALVIRLAPPVSAIVCGLLPSLCPGLTGVLVDVGEAL